MNTKKILHAYSMAVLLTGWGTMPVLAQEEASVDITGEAASAENVVSILEDVAIDFGDSVDVYEVKCTQSSHSIRVTVTDSGSNDDKFTFSLVATSPPTILGQGEVEYVPAGGSNTDSVLRPAADGPMKALLSVWGNGSVALRTYTLDAECRNSANVTRNTVVTVKQYE